VKVVPATELVVVYERGLPLHTDSLDGLVITGVGFTVTVYVKEEPLHPYAAGVIKYCTAIGELVVLMRLSVIELDV
jgi:hypothetical protein